METRRDLELPPDGQRIPALETAARAASRGYELVTWSDRTPDELIDDRALLAQRMTTDVPLGDLPVDEEHWDAARIREFEATPRGPRPHRPVGSGTLVLREHRGHRLGALMKTAVLREVLTAFPSVRRISTYNSDGNASMVAVNEALGFRPVGRLSTWSLRL